jgi:hypothetical protein
MAWMVGSVSVRMARNVNKEQHEHWVVAAAADGVGVCWTDAHRSWSMLSLSPARSSSVTAHLTRLVFYAPFSLADWERTRHSGQSSFKAARWF